MLKNKNGSSILTTPIIVAIGILMVSVLVLLVVEIIIPYLWYEKLSSTCIKYIYVMEEFGYLTTKEVNVLKKDLENQGFDENKIKIEYAKSKTDYGDPIYLKLLYDYELKLPLMEPQIVKMQVERNSVCKR